MSNTVSKSNTMFKSNTMSKTNTMGKNCRVSYSMSNRVSYSSSILGNSIISNISNISIIVIGMVVNMLSTTIRKVDRVGTLYNTSTIIGLCLVECSTRVVISNSIGVRIGRGFSKVRLCISTNSMSNNWSMVENRSMGNGYRVSNSMSNWSTNNSMSKSMN